MKKCTVFKWILLLAAIAAAAVILFQNFGDKIPFLSRLTDDEIQPEEDLFEDGLLSYEDTGDREIPAQSEHEERRQAKIRRGYIPLKLHNS